MTVTTKHDLGGIFACLTLTFDLSTSKIQRGDRDTMGYFTFWISVSLRPTRT